MNAKIGMTQTHEIVKYGGVDFVLHPQQNSRLSDFLLRQDLAREPKSWEKFVARIRAIISGVKMSRLVDTLRRARMPGRDLSAHVVNSNDVNRHFNLARAKVAAINARHSTTTNSVPCTNPTDVAAGLATTSPPTRTDDRQANIGMRLNANSTASSSRIAANGETINAGTNAMNREHDTRFAYTTASPRAAVSIPAPRPDLIPPRSKG